MKPSENILHNFFDKLTPATVFAEEEKKIRAPCLRFRCGDVDRHGVLLSRLRGPEGRRERAQLFQEAVSE